VVLNAIKSVPKGPNEKEIVNIMLEGQTVQYVCKGKATFYGIKFSSTSFKNDVKNIKEINSNHIKL